MKRIRKKLPTNIKQNEMPDRRERGEDGGSGVSSGEGDNDCMFMLNLLLYPHFII